MVIAAEESPETLPCSPRQSHRAGIRGGQEGKLPWAQQSKGAENGHMIVNLSDGTRPPSTQGKNANCAPIPIMMSKLRGPSTRFSKSLPLSLLLSALQHKEGTSIPTVNHCAQGSRPSWNSGLNTQRKYTCGSRQRISTSVHPVLRFTQLALPHKTALSGRPGNQIFICRAGSPPPQPVTRQ